MYRHSLLQDQPDTNKQRVTPPVIAQPKMNQVSTPSSSRESVCQLLEYFIEFTFLFKKKPKAAASPVPSAPKAGNYDQYHDILDRHKQKMADGERNMDEWNKSIIDFPNNDRKKLTNLV